MQMQTDLQLTPIRIHMYTFCQIFDYDLQDSYDVTKTSPELYLIGFLPVDSRVDCTGVDYMNIRLFKNEKMIDLFGHMVRVK